MKELVLTLPSNSSDLWSEQIGILVINDQYEMLLHKHSPGVTRRAVWETPFLLPRNITRGNPYDDAHLFLTNLGIDGELHEAFISPPTSRQATLANINHLIIALTSAKTTDLVTQHTTSQCIAFDQVIHDAHEHPESYALWFRNSLDGVALYLKNLLKQSRLRMPEQQVELS